MSRSVTVSKKLLAQTRELIANGLVTGVATREMMPAQTAITLTEIQYSSPQRGNASYRPGVQLDLLLSKAEDYRAN